MILAFPAVRRLFAERFVVRSKGDGPFVHLQGVFAGLDAAVAYAEEWAYWDARAIVFGPDDGIVYDTACSGCLRERYGCPDVTVSVQHSCGR